MQIDKNLITALNEWAVIQNRKDFSTLISSIKEEGLSMSQVNTLFHLKYKGPGTVSGIAEKLGVTNAATSQMLEGLVSREFVSRIEDPDDRRVKKITVTDKGLKFLNRGREERNIWLKSLSSMIPREKKQEVLNAVTLLIKGASLLEKNNSSTKRIRKDNSK